MSDLAELRSPAAADVPFIRHSWVMSYCKHATLGDWQPERGVGSARCSSSIYVPEQHALIAQILQRAQCIVACNREDEEQIFGYVVFEEQDDRPCFHYVYVKEKFRKLGIGRALIEEAARLLPKGPLWASHWSNLAPVVLKPAQVEYNPFRASSTKGAHNDGTDRA